MCLLWPLLGGLRIDRLQYLSFNDSAKVVSPTDLTSRTSTDGSRIPLGVRPHLTSIGLPFLFQYQRTSPPYALLVHPPDSGAVEQSWRMKITDALVEYTDGQIYRKGGQTDCGGQADADVPTGPAPTFKSSSGTVIPSIGCEVSDLVRRQVSGKITLNGWLEKRSGERAPFTTSQEFSPASSLYFGPGVLSPRIATRVGLGWSSVIQKVGFPTP